MTSARRMGYAEDGGAAITLVTTSQTFLISVTCEGVKVGEKLVLMGTMLITTGLDCTRFGLEFKEGVDVGDSDIPEEMEFATEDSVTDSGEIIVVTRAYQDDPVYGLFGQQLVATGNGTAEFYSITALRVN